MRWLLILMIAISGMASAQTCYDGNGEEIEVPAGYKIIFIPKWVDVEDIRIESRVAREPDLVSVCEDGSLAVSPTVCPEVKPKTECANE